MMKMTRGVEGEFDRGECSETPIRSVYNGRSTASISIFYIKGADREQVPVCPYFFGNREGSRESGVYSCVRLSGDAPK